MRFCHVHPQLSRLAFMLLCALTTARAAEAQHWSRHHASSCRPSFFWDAKVLAIESAGVTHAKTVGPLTLRCAALDTSEQPDSNVTEVRVYVRDSNPSESISVRACRTHFSKGSSCGPWIETGKAFVGEAVLILGPAELLEWLPDETSFLDISIPAIDSERGSSYLKGWIASAIG